MTTEMEPPAPTTGERLAPWLVGLVLAAPVLWVASPPMCDFPQYELMVALLQRYGDPLHAPRDLYALSLGNSNQGFFALALPLALLTSARTACKLVIALSIAGFPVAAARLAAQLGRTRWGALLVAPFALGLMFRWGLIANLLGLVLFLLAVPSFDRFAAAPSRREGLRAALWALAFAAVHNSAPFVLGSVALAAALAARPSARGVIVRLLPLVPATALVGAQFLLYRTHVTSAFRTITALHHGWREKVLHLPLNLYGPIDPSLALTLLGLFAVGVATLAWGVAPSASTAPPEAPLRRHRFLLAAALLALQYAVWPYGIAGTGWLYVRFLVPALTLVAIAAPPAGALVRARLVVVLAALAGAPLMLLAVAPAFEAAHQGYTSLDRLLPLVAPGATLVGLNFTEPPGSLAIFNHAHAHVVAVRGGRSHDQFSEMPHMPVRFREGRSWETTLGRVFRPTDLVPEVDARRFRYLLARVPSPDMVPALTAALAGGARPVATSGAWTLYESRLSAGSPMAPDAPLPRAHPPTLGRRLGVR